MKTVVNLAIFGAQKGVIDTDKEGNKLPLEKHMAWASVQGLESVRNDDPTKVGNSVVKLSCSHECFDEVRKTLHPGETKEFSFECEMRPGAKQKISLFAVRATPAKSA